MKQLHLVRLHRKPVPLLQRNNMATLFYDHLINWQRLHDALNELGIDGEERLEIMEDIEHTVHTEVLMVFVTHLPAETHQEFIERFHAAPFDESHLHFLTTHSTADIQRIVTERTDQLLTEIIAELSED